LTFRFVADSLPRLLSSSYSTACPSLSELRPARSTALMWRTTKRSNRGSARKVSNFIQTPDANWQRLDGQERVVTEVALSESMQRYRVYKTTNDGHILGPALVIECQDDQAAIGKAARAANGCAAELWEGVRMIVRFPGDDATG
jgi:hypothetical protein